jgi:hypothetical protein
MFVSAEGAVLMYCEEEGQHLIQDLWHEGGLLFEGPEFT